jgi:hypothetical protein
MRKDGDLFMWTSLNMKTTDFFVSIVRLETLSQENIKI